MGALISHVLVILPPAPRQHDAQTDHSKTSTTLYLKFIGTPEKSISSVKEGRKLPHCITAATEVPLVPCKTQPLVQAWHIYSIPTYSDYSTSDPVLSTCAISLTINTVF